jgi:hypothetical protein
MIAHPDISRWAAHGPSIEEGVQSSGRRNSGAQLPKIPTVTVGHRAVGEEKPETTATTIPSLFRPANGDQDGGYSACCGAWQMPKQRTGRFHPTYSGGWTHCWTEGSTMRRPKAGAPILADGIWQSQSITTARTK